MNANCVTTKEHFLYNLIEFTVYVYIDQFNKASKPTPARKKI